jgi:two-component system response regulator YesN
MICEEYNVSTTTISKTFKEYAGVNYHEYVSRLRIEKAKELIRETEMNIAQIGKSIGYEHEFSFRRAFKRYEGINPEEYRKLILQ